MNRRKFIASVLSLAATNAIAKLTFSEEIKLPPQPEPIGASGVSQTYIGNGSTQEIAFDKPLALNKPVSIKIRRRRDSKPWESS